MRQHYISFKWSHNYPQIDVRECLIVAITCQTDAEENYKKEYARPKKAEGEQIIKLSG